MSPHREAGAKERQPGTGGDLTVMKKFWAEFGVLPAALGAEIAAWEPERAVLTSSGPALCRQVGSRQWVGEVLETLAALSAGLLATGLGEQPQTIVAPYGATVRTIYHLRPSSSASVEAEARWVRRGRTQAVIETTVRDAEGKELVRTLSQHVAIPEPLAFSLADLRQAHQPNAWEPNQ